MEIVAKVNGVWQEVSQPPQNAVFIDFLSVATSCDLAMEREGEFRAKGSYYFLLPVGREHLIPAEAVLERQVRRGVNLISYSRLLDLLVQEVELVQNSFSVTLFDEYPLQGALDDFRHEAEALLFKARLKELLSLQPQEWEQRAKLTFDLLKQIDLQVDYAEKMADAVRTLEERFPALASLAKKARAYSSVVRKESLVDLISLVEEYRKEPVLIGSFQTPEIADLVSHYR